METAMFFPAIETINDVAPFINGAEEFVIAERDWGFVVNYIVNFEDTFPIGDAETLAFRRECRGIKFDRLGRILARPYHKFFNVGERADTAPSLIDLTKSHIILDKLDGSMVHPIYVDGDLVMCTKMGDTDVAKTASNFIKQQKPNSYVALMADCEKNGLTPIFEWCSRRNRIVIDYVEDALVLTAVRHKVSGEYLSYDDLFSLAQKYGVPVVGVVLENNNIDRVIEIVNTIENIEGFIVRFSDGEMYKIKAEDYVRMHKAKDSIRLEKNIIKIIFNEQADDFIALLNEVDSAEFKKYADAVKHKFFNTASTYADVVERELKSYKDRKDFAINGPKDDVIKNLVFQNWGATKGVRESVYEALRVRVLKNCSTQKAIDNIRYLWDGLTWNYTPTQDDD